ncbi:unnamed protein product [Discosporangium mesarthrocarpum]
MPRSFSKFKIYLSNSLHSLGRPLRVHSFPDPGYSKSRCHLCFALCSSGSSTRCNECTASYCSKRCQENDEGVHVHGGECYALANLGQLGMAEEENTISLRLMLRLAAAWATEKGRCDQIDGNPQGTLGNNSVPTITSDKCTFDHVASLESHVKDAPKSVRDAVKDVARALVSILPSKCGLSRKKLTSLFFTAQCNAHAIHGEGKVVLGLGLFPLASMVNHSCLPNCHHSFCLPDSAPPTPKSERGGVSNGPCPEGGSPGDEKELTPPAPPMAVFRATKTIPAGTELAYSYIDLYQPTPTRRALLEKAYFFRCSCSRCSMFDTALAGAPDATPGGTTQAAKAELSIGGLTCLSEDCEGPVFPTVGAEEGGGRGGGGGGGGRAGMGGSSGEPPDPESTAPTAITAPGPQALWACVTCGRSEPGVQAASRLALAEDEAEQFTCIASMVLSGETDLDPDTLTMAQSYLRRVVGHLSDGGRGGRGVSGLHHRHHLMLRAYQLMASVCGGLASMGEGGRDVGGVVRPALVRERAVCLARALTCMEGVCGDCATPEIAELYRELGGTLAQLQAEEDRLQAKEKLARDGLKSYERYQGGEGAGEELWGSLKNLLCPGAMALGDWAAAAEECLSHAESMWVTCFGLSREG